MPPTLVRLKRRALEGGPVAPSNVFFVLTQGHAVTSGRRDRSSPSLSTLCGHPRPCSATPRTAATTPALLERAGAGRRPARRCTPYGSTVNGTLKSAHYSSQVANRCATTLEATPVRAQDAPRRLNRSGIRQDGRQLHNTARHTSTRRETVRHACKLPSPWLIKGGAVHQLWGGGRRTAITHTLSAFSTILALASIKPLGLGGHAFSPASLVATPLRAPRCKQYSVPSTPLLDVRPRSEPG
jgi:hypothetical protein